MIKKYRNVSTFYKDGKIGLSLPSQAKERKHKQGHERNINYG